jgi:hypothetical protein
VITTESLTWKIDSLNNRRTAKTNHGTYLIRFNGALYDLYLNSTKLGSGYLTTVTDIADSDHQRRPADDLATEGATAAVGTLFRADVQAALQTEFDRVSQSDNITDSIIRVVLRRLAHTLNVTLTGPGSEGPI